MLSMHRIFTIREIVEEILSYVPSGRLPTPARVSRLWFFSSLRPIWCFVTIKEALTPLGVNDLDKKNSKSCCEPPTPSQWARFIIYSKHVRDVVGHGSEVHLLETATRSLPDTIPDLFPNLRSIRWHIILHKKLPDLSLFNSPLLESIYLELRSLPFPVFHLFCDTLAKRVEALRSLQILFHEPSKDTYTAKYNESFNQVLQAFSSTLINVQIPEAFHTEETVQELGKLRNLSEFEIGRSTSPPLDKCSVRRWRYNQEECDGKEKEYFGRLKKLSFTGSQQAFCDRFLNKGTFSSLIEIHWEQCMKLDDPKSFVTCVSDLCPMLKSLTLGDCDMYLDEEGRLPPVIPWAIISILLKCQRLTELALHCCRVSMTPEDLVELLTSRLNGTPTMWKGLQIYTEIPLSISDLLLFAKYCPHLEKLGMHLDVPSINDTPSPLAVAQADTQSPPEHGGREFTFTRMWFVNFAYSPLDLDLIPKFASFFIKLCDVIPYVDGWEWLEFWYYVYESEEAQGKIPGADGT